MTHQHIFEIVPSKAERNKGVLYYICQFPRCYFTKPVNPYICQCGEIFDEITIKEHIEIEYKLGNYKNHHYVTVNGMKEKNMIVR